MPVYALYTVDLKYVCPECLKSDHCLPHRMSKFDKEKLKRKMGGFREQLKSTGQSKFALDDKEEVSVIVWFKLINHIR